MTPASTLRAALIALLLLTAMPAPAADWQTLSGSTLTFRASYQGEAFDGSFRRFQPQIRFDPAHLADSRFDVRIALASADTRNGERDELLKGADFFDTGKTPEARYTATKFRALGGNRYAADGSLSLHGVARPVTLTFTWTPGAKPMLEGTAVLQRLDFGVGGGDWTDTGLIPNEVTVRTRLLLAPAAAVKATAARKPGAG